MSGRREKSQRLRAQLFQVSAVQAFSARLGHGGHVKWTLLLFFFLMCRLVDIKATVLSSAKLSAVLVVSV